MKLPEADRLVQESARSLNAGWLDQADALLVKALQAEPGHLMALTRRADIAVFRKESGRAIGLLDQVLRAEPYFAPAWAARGRALWLAGRNAEAVEAAARALDIQPPNPEYQSLLAQFAAWNGDDALASETIKPLLRWDGPDAHRKAGAVSLAGERALARGRFQEAGTLFAQALEVAPDLASARMLLGMNQLRLGDFEAGWVNYATREEIRSLYPYGSRDHPGRQWKGEDLAGHSLLIYDDQGFGDAIHFFRYVPALRARGAAITWSTMTALVRLFSQAAPDIAVTAGVPPGVAFDFHCSSSSLPRWMGTTLETIPAFTRYLYAPARPRAAAKKGAARRLRVGMVWSGDIRHTRDHLRSIPAEQFLRLADVPGISVHSLQHQVRPDDVAALASRPAILRDIESAADFADTAALIQKLDLIIAVDTGMAHLAAALGKPVWIVLHVAPDWRWLTDREDSPWYPTVRLFRVTPDEWPNGRDRGWTPVLERVSAALRARLAG